ncbi:MAG: SGNH/GDSL hydrolase family protein [Cyanobacteria bacterium J06623_7]
MSLSSNSDRLDFDGQDLAAGTIVSNQFPGVEFSTLSTLDLMLFDTDNVTGEDFDLAATDLGHVLIISEDGDTEDPDDNAAGGVIRLQFEETVTVEGLDLLDIDEPGSSLTFYDEDSNLIETVAIADTGDNSTQTLEFDLRGVSSIELNLAGSGALTGVDFTVDSSDNASEYSNIYAFGDSLLDTGNLFNVTTFARELAPPGTELFAIPPSPPYFAGRFSNGPIWLDNLAAELDIEITPASELSLTSPGGVPSPITIIDGILQVSPFFDGLTGDRSVNFAYGLATTGASGTGELGEFVPGITRQVEFFVGDLVQSDQTADSDALYIFWGGSNDYFLPDTEVAETVGNIETQIDSLYDLGARDFLVVNLPDLALLPEANNPNLLVSPAELTERTEAHNLLLDSSVAELSDSLTGIDITLIDANSLFDDVVNDPAEFGLTNVSEPFLDPLTFTPTVGANPNEFFFFDTLHPTATGHAILSDLVVDTLEIESEL